MAYDAHGHTVSMANQSMTYDVADRHISTTVIDGTTTTIISYGRDVTGRIVARTRTDNGSAATIRYLFHSASMFRIANNTGALTNETCHCLAGSAL